MTRTSIEWHAQIKKTNALACVDAKHNEHVTFNFEPRVEKSPARCQLRFRTGRRSFVCSMASETAAGSRPYWSDYEITVDKDGLPHYTGHLPHLMKEYRRRVLFAFGSLEGDGETPEKEQVDLDRKQRRFAVKLINGLHGEAWRAVEHLVAEPEKLRVKDGYKAIFAALQAIEKEGIVNKTEAFDLFFEQVTRRRGEPIDGYLRKKVQAWQDLQDLDEVSSMSEDLLSYFILKGCSLSRDDRRSILLANKNAYTRTGIEQALRVSYHDLHELERTQQSRPDLRRNWNKTARKSYAAYDDGTDDLVDDHVYEAMVQSEEPYDEDADWPEDEMADLADEDYDEYGDRSDGGASQDDEVCEAYVAYKEARKKLRVTQKARGFYKTTGAADSDRKALIEKEKQTSRCSACHRVGHWAGDAVCPKSGHSGPNVPRVVGSLRASLVEKGSLRAVVDQLIWYPKHRCFSIWVMTLKMMMSVWEWNIVSWRMMLTQKKPNRWSKMPDTQNKMIAASRPMLPVPALPIPNGIESAQVPCRQMLVRCQS